MPVATKMSSAVKKIMVSEHNYANGIMYIPVQNLMIIEKTIAMNLMERKTSVGALFALPGAHWGNLLAEQKNSSKELASLQSGQPHDHEDSLRTT